MSHIDMNEKVCKGCGKTKPLDQFGRHNRSSDKHKANCLVCTGEADPVADEGEPIVSSGARLEILPGFGFRASIDDDRLSIEQDDSNGNTDNISLSRTEAKVLFAQFSDWVSA